MSDAQVDSSNAAPVYWSAYSSLYGDLPPQLVVNVEVAVRYRTCGFYEDALQTFSSLLPLPKTCAIVAIELSLLHDQRGTEPEALLIITQTLESVEKGEYTVPDSVHWLLRIMKASYEYTVTGQLRPALSTARALHDWAEHFDPEQYTDVLVGCVWYYQTIVKMCRRFSNWCNPNDGNLPSTPEQSPAASLRYLRRLLMKQNRAIEAGKLVKDESTATTGPDSWVPFREYIERYENHERNQDDPIGFRILTSKLFLAQALGEEKRFEEGQKLIDEVTELYSTASEGPSIHSSPRLKILLKNAEPYVLDLEDSPEKLDRYLKVAETAGSVNELHIQRSWLINAYHVVDRLANKGKDVQSRPYFTNRRDELLRQHLEFELKTNSPLHIAATLMLIGFDLNVLSRSSEFLEYYSKFRTSWPLFDQPFIAHRLCNNAYTAAQNIGDEELAERYHKEGLILRSACPWYTGSEEPSAYRFSDGSDHLRDWRLIPPGMGEHTSILDKRLWLSCRILVHWLSHDLELGNVDEEAARTLIAGLAEAAPHEKAALVSYIRNIDPSVLSLSVYGIEGKIRDSSSWDAWFGTLEPWLRRADLPPSLSHRHYLLYVVGFCRGMCLNLSHPGGGIPNDHYGTDYLINRLKWTEQYHRILETLDESLDLEREKVTAKSNEATALLLLANHQYSRSTGVATVEMLERAINIKKRLCEHYRSLSNLPFVYHTLTSLARAHSIKYRAFKGCQANACLPFYEQADTVFREMVSGYSLLSSFQSFQARNKLSEEMDHAQTLEHATMNSAQAFIDYYAANQELAKQDFISFARGAEYQALVLDLVFWSQKRKARALTDAMGLGAQYPEAMAQRARNSPQAMDLLREYEQLGAKLEGVSMTEQMEIRDQMRNLKLKMREVEELRPILDINDGITVSHQDLIDMCKDLEEDVVFVDWIDMDWVWPWNLSYALYKNGVLQNVFIVNELKLKDVDDWVQANLEADGRLWHQEEDLKFCPLNDRTSQKRLDRLRPLVDNLQHLTQPGQIIVFAPTLALYRVPFHAIRCGSQILIERNPVLYCQSLTVLRLCLMSRARLQESVPESLRPVVFNPLSNETATSSTVSEIATMFGTTVHDARDFDRAKFLETFSSATMIHFHGHVRFDEANPLSHHLELVPGPRSDSSSTTDDESTQFSSDPSTAPLAADQILTSQDVFSLSLIPGSHITTISCKSARAKISKANEQLGLLTAFHYAGASSAICTLWNIHRDDGGLFAKAFYESLIEDWQSDGDRGRWVDGARAMQKAVLAVRRDAQGNLRSPYHWAGFVFNGAWVWPRPRWVWEARSEPDVDDAKEEMAEESFSGVKRHGTWA